MLKRYALLVAICSTMGFGGCFGRGCGACAKNTTQTITRTTVETAKGTAKGIKDGIDEGRKSSESADGAVVVTKAEEVFKYITVEVFSYSASGEEAVKVDLAFTNSHSSPVRIVGLHDKAAMMALDKDGFSTYLAKGQFNPSQITVQANAKEKYSFYFDGNIAKLKKVKFFGKELPLKKDDIK